MPRISRIKLCIPVFQELTYGTYKKFKKITIELAFALYEMLTPIYCHSGAINKFRLI